MTADWRRRHDMMTPLFVETINSAYSDQPLDFYSAQTAGRNKSMEVNNFLRATQTQSLQFQATQDIKIPYNWLNQTYMDTFKIGSSYGSLFSESQSALLFSVNRKTVLSNENDQEILRLRRKFVKDNTTSDQQNRFFARKQVTQ